MDDRYVSLTLMWALAETLEKRDPEVAKALRKLCRRFALRTLLH